MKISILVWVFCVVFSQCTQAQLADSSKRLVRLEGVQNFRDVGGYVTKDGTTVKWGKIFRSAVIDKLTDADVILLENKHVHYVVDFRGNAEAAKAPDRLPENTVYLLLPAGSTSGNMSQFFRQQTEGESIMLAFYGNTETLIARYKPFFQQLLQLPDGEALLFHCTAGKDRTGMAAALLLHALGVNLDTIMEDYTATNVYWRAEKERSMMEMEKMGLTTAVAAALLDAKPRYLRSMFETIEKKYGSVDSFLKDGLGLNDMDIEKLKSMYTE